MRRTVQFLLAIALSVAPSFAVTPIIGVASAFGTFVVNNAEVEGNANIFDGSQLKTGKASSQVSLQNGASVIVGINSSATLFRDHLVLEQGATRVNNMNGYVIEAENYRIESVVPTSQAVVRLEEDAVEVAALTGSLKVLNEKGVLLTRIGAGTASAFQTRATPANGTPQEVSNARKRREAAMLLLSGIVLTGLGLAVAAIVQPSPTSP
jgi:hypothetical protein